MLKILVILAILSAVVPIQEGSGADKAKQGDSQEKPTQQSAPSPSKPPVIQKADADTFKDTGQTKSPHEVQVVGSPSKDYWDKAGVIINGLLAFVGVGGICVAIGTLRKLERQTGAAEKQIILQFRPKLIIRGGKVGEKGEARFFITNSGGTKAHVVGSHILFYASETMQNGQRARTVSEAVPLAGDIREFTAGESMSISISLGAELIADIASQLAQAGRGEPFTKVFRCEGGITYRDELGIERMTIISRRYDPASGRFAVDKNAESDYAD